MPRSRNSAEPTGKDSSIPTAEALKGEVLDALRLVLKDKSAPAAAKASAGRTILEYFTEKDQGLSNKRSSEMTLDEIDAVIARTLKEQGMP